MIVSSRAIRSPCVLKPLPHLLHLSQNKEREEKKNIEEQKRVEEEAKKAVITAKRKAAYQQRKKEEEERKRIVTEKRKIAYDKHRKKQAELKAEMKKAQGVSAALSKVDKTTPSFSRKRGPGRPPKAETLAKMQAQFLLQQQQEAAAAAASDGHQPIKRGRGRPRKDGSAPIPRKLATKSEISMSNLYLDTTDVSIERSRSGRKIQRTVFHDEIEGGGLMKKLRTDEHPGIAGSVPYVAERSAAAAAKSAIAGGGRKPEMGKKEPRRKPGARECMQMSRKFTTEIIDQKYFDVLMVSDSP